MIKWGRLPILCGGLILAGVTEAKQNKQIQEEISSDQVSSKPFHTTLAFSQTRYEYKNDRYGRTQALLIKSQYRWQVGKDKLLKLKGSYFAGRDSVFLTPSTTQIEQSTALGSEQALGATNTYAGFGTQLDRPQTSQDHLGWLQRLSIGAQWQAGHRNQRYTAVSLGLVYLMSQKQQSLPVISPWLCLDAQGEYLWISFMYQGEPCLVLHQAQAQLMMGLKLGRAKLGLGWGVSQQTEIDRLIEKAKQGGLAAWLSLPLNAAIYLEMSLNLMAQTQMLLDRVDELGASSTFMVGLTWTGESKELELEAPKTNAKQPYNQQSSPPVNPSQTQPLFSPSPLQGPRQGQPMPSRPSTPSTPL